MVLLLVNSNTTDNTICNDKFGIKLVKANRSSGLNYHQKINKVQINKSNRIILFDRSPKSKRFLQLISKQQYEFCNAARNQKNCSD